MTKPTCLPPHVACKEQRLSALASPLQPQQRRAHQHQHLIHQAHGPTTHNAHRRYPDKLFAHPNPPCFVAPCKRNHFKACDVGPHKPNKISTRGNGTRFNKQIKIKKRSEGLQTNQHPNKRQQCRHGHNSAHKPS